MDFFIATLNLIQTILIAIGAGLGLWGVVNLLEGYGSENPANRSQGIKQFVAGGGIVLIGTQLVPKLAELF